MAEARRSGALRRGVCRVAAACSLLGGLAAATTWVDLGWTPWAAVQALVPVSVLGSVVFLGLAVVVARGELRTLRLTSLGLVLTVLLLASSVWVTRGIRLPPATGDPGSAQALRVMTFNARFSEADTDALMRHIEEIEPDVVVLLEANAAFVGRLDDAGTAELMPHRRVALAPGYGATSVLSQLPLSGGEAPESLGAFESWLVQVQVGERPVALRAVHPRPPMAAGPWRRELTKLRDWVVRDAPRDLPLVVAGDLNAGPPHPVFRSLCDDRAGLRGCVGTWRGHTWPANGERGPRLPEFARIDHVLARDLGVADSGVFSVPGTDHHGVWAHLTWR